MGLDWLPPKIRPAGLLRSSTSSANQASWSTSPSIPTHAGHPFRRRRGTISKSHTTLLHPVDFRKGHEPGPGFPQRCTPLRRFQDFVGRPDNPSSSWLNFPVGTGKSMLQEIKRRIQTDPASTLPRVPSAFLFPELVDKSDHTICVKTKNAAKNIFPSG